MTRRLKPTPWERIYMACERGTGVRLSPDDIQALGSDDALMVRGNMDGSLRLEHKRGEHDEAPDSECWHCMERDQPATWHPKVGTVEDFERQSQATIDYVKNMCGIDMEREP